MADAPQPPLILVAEDSAHDRLIITEAFREAGIAVAETPSVMADTLIKHIKALKG